MAQIDEEEARSSMTSRRMSMNEQFPILEVKYLQAFQEYCQQEKAKLAKRLFSFSSSP